LREERIKPYRFTNIANIRDGAGGLENGEIHDQK